MYSSQKLEIYFVDLGLVGRNDEVILTKSFQKQATRDTILHEKVGTFNMRANHFLWGTGKS